MPTAYVPKLSPWGRFKLWLHARRLRRITAHARRSGLVLLEAGMYRAAIDRLVRLDAYVDQSGGLADARRFAFRDKIKEHVRDAITKLATGEKLGSEENFRSTLERISAGRAAHASHRERRKHLVDAVTAMNQRLVERAKNRGLPAMLAHDQLIEEEAGP